MRKDGMFVMQVKKIRQNTGVALAVLVDDNFSKQEIDRHVHCGMSVAEIRIDMFGDKAPNHVKNQISNFSAIPTLATIRKTGDGGYWDNPEAIRVELFKSIIPHVGAVDIELSEPETISTINEFRSSHTCDLIASYHNFDQTPDNHFLHSLIRQAKEADADAVKIACMANSDEDCARLAGLFDRDVDMPKIIIGMGPLGLKTRISFPSLGSLLTYSPSDRITAAYGQISFLEMIEQLHDYYPRFNKG